MSCDRYAPAIADHACGADLAPDTAAHLATCAACTARLVAQRRAIDGLDGELQQLLALEPSPHFVPRVQAHVRAKATARPRMLWVWSGVAAAAAVIIAAVVVTVREPNTAGQIETTITTAAAPESSRASESVIVERNASSTGPEPSRIERRRRPRPAPVAAAAREPEVIVPPGQMEAVERYMALVRSGRLDTSKLANTADDNAVPAELVLGPLAVGPITVTEIDEAASSAVERRHEQE